MIPARTLRNALHAFNVSRIESAGIRFTMNAVRAWGPEFTAELSLYRFPRSADAPESASDRLRIDLGAAIVRNGYTDEGRQFHPRPGEWGGGSWEYRIDSHGSPAIYLPETASFRLDRGQIVSIYACARMCDEMQFQLWLDGDTSPVLVEKTMHGDSVSVHCGHAAGRRMPTWEHRIESRVGPHNLARAGSAMNVWPRTRQIMDALQWEARRDERPGLAKANVFPAQSGTGTGGEL